MSFAHHFLPHRHQPRPLPGELCVGTWLAGIAALVVLVAFLGALAGGVTWVLVHVVSSALG